MNQNTEDPNNHVPEVSPDDDWDDLDDSNGVASQPPRPDRKLPPKSERDLASKTEPGHLPNYEANVEPAKEPQLAKELEVQGIAAPSESADVSAVETAMSQRGGSLKGEHISTKRERNRWGSTHGRGPIGWLFYSGIGVVALTVFAVFLHQTSDQRKTRESEKSFFSRLEPAKKKLNDQSAVMDESTPAEILSRSKTQAIKMYAEFVKADSVEEMLPLVFQAKGNESLIRKEWKPSAVGEEWIPSDESLWSLQDADDGPYAILSGTSRDYSGFTAFFRLEDAELKLDWRATTGYCSATFEELRAGKGDPVEIRAFIDRSDYYNYSFPEESNRSFRLVSPDGDSILWVYTEIGTRADEEISELFEPGQITGVFKNESAVTVSLLRGAESSMPNQWRIGRLLRPNWLEDVR
jgi:hypothetical protein